MFSVGTQGTRPVYRGSPLAACPIRDIAVAVGRVCEGRESSYGRDGKGFKLCPLSRNFLR